MSDYHCVICRGGFTCEEHSIERLQRENAELLADAARVEDSRDKLAGQLMAAEAGKVEAEKALLDVTTVAEMLMNNGDVGVRAGRRQVWDKDYVLLRTALIQAKAAASAKLRGTDV